MLKTVDKRLGKTIVHKNLVMARINDLSLRVALEKALIPGKEYVALSDEFFAFPSDLVFRIQQLVNKNGHAMKTVNADD